MGVFARFLRRSKGTEEASTAEAATAAETVHTEAEEAKETPGTDAGDAGAKAGATAEGVEIPKQQRVEEAADNEAGEGARK
ncbi:hypothetical protein ACWCP6_22805 [Streptomyces sp. NPDC002004]